MRRGEGHGIDLSVSARRGYHDDLLDSGHLGGNDVHENGGRISRLAAGNVDADTGKRCDLLAQYRSIRLAVKPAVRLLLLVEGPDILHGALHDLQKSRFHLSHGLFNLLFCHPDGGGVYHGMVKLLCIGKYGRVAVTFYCVHDLLDRI